MLVLSHGGKLNAGSNVQPRGGLELMSRGGKKTDSGSFWQKNEAETSTGNKEFNRRFGKKNPNKRTGMRGDVRVDRDV